MRPLLMIAILLVWGSSVRAEPHGVDPLLPAPAGGEQVGEEGERREAAAGIAPPSWWDSVRTIDVGSWRIPAGDAAIGPRQVGVTILGPDAAELVDLAAEGDWEVSAGDQWVWRLRLRSPGAAGLRVRLACGAIPTGATLRLYDESGGAHELAPRDDLWSPAVLGDGAGLEYTGRAGDQTEPSVRVIDIAVMDGGPGAGAGAGGATVLRRSSSCSVGSTELACHAAITGDDPMQRAVVALTYVSDRGGVFACTGTLVRDARGGTAIPYVLTAAHCVDSSSEAATVEALWFYGPQSGQSPCARDLPVSEGATLAATVAQTDTTLLVLRQSPPAGAYAAPISLSPVGAGERDFTSVHHPGGGVQRAYARPAVTSGACQTSSVAWRAPQSYEVRWVNGRSIGTFESGSSGAPLVDAQGNVRGTLRGVCYPGGDNFDLCEGRAQVQHFFGSLAAAWDLGLSEAMEPAPADDAYEPNNSVSQAKPIGVSGGTLDLRLIDRDDYFSLSVSPASRLEITLFGQALRAGGSFDPDIFLLDATGAVLASSTSPSTQEAVALDVRAGTYTLRVQRYSESANDRGSYRLTVRATAAPSTGGAGTSPGGGSGGVPGGGSTSAPGGGSSPSASQPETPTSPVVDRQVSALRTRLDVQSNGAVTRGRRLASATQTQVERLRARGVAEERIMPRIERSLSVIESLRSSTETALSRSADATTRTLGRLSQRDASLAPAVEAAINGAVAQALEAARTTLTDGLDEQRTALEALRDAAAGAAP